MLTLDDGKELVKLARRTIENFFKKKKLKIEKTRFKEKKGVFVSIHTFPDHELRGCIGYPYPVLPLGEATQRAAFSAAFEDSRFPPLREEELSKVVFEVSVLTLPKLIKVENPKDYPKKIEIGKDGLIVEYNFFKGLLLPQVAVEFKWDAETFLQQTCLKAGLLPDMWLDPKTKIYKFQCKIFKEKEPGGEVIQT